jgi:hypothetical protein
MDDDQGDISSLSDMLEVDIAAATKRKEEKWVDAPAALTTDARKALEEQCRQ